MLRAFSLSVLTLVLLVAGCMPLSTSIPAPTLPAVTDEWNVKMTHSGGIMGLMRSIEVSSDGKYTVSDERLNKKVTGNLAGDELETLSGIIKNVDLADLEIPNRAACADCFIYDIEILSAGKGVAIQLNDISLPDSGWENLVTTLRGLIDSVLK